MSNYELTLLDQIIKVKKNQIASEEKSISFPNNQTINLNRKLLK